MVTYYDIVLGLIPLALFGISGALLTAGIPYTLAVPGAAIVSVSLILHATFVNGPSDGSGTAPPPMPTTSTDPSTSRTSE